jgi:hypothetical protein
MLVLIYNYSINYILLELNQLITYHMFLYFMVGLRGGSVARRYVLEELMLFVWIH